MDSERLAGRNFDVFRQFAGFRASCLARHGLGCAPQVLNFEKSKAENISKNRTTHF